MHFVTKVLVVFATILSVFLSALVISYAVNTDRVQANYSTIQADLESMKGQLSAQAISHATEKKTLEDRVELKSREAAEARNSLRDLESRVATLLTTQRTLQDSADKAQALANQLATTNETQTKLIDSLRKDANDSRGKQVEIAKLNADLEKAIADLRRSYEAAENEKKLVREQLAEAKTQLDALRAGGGVLGAVKANEPFVYSGPTITGKVEEVSTDAATGALLAKISIGSNDNIRDNMKLAIRRDNEFVGNLVILKTDLKFAIGKIDLLGRPVAVQVGDVVQTNLQ